MTNAVLASLSVSIPEPRFSTEEMLDAASDRFTPELRQMIRSAGIERRHSILFNYKDVLFHGAKADWNVQSVELGVRAARNCLAKVPSSVGDIGFVIGVTNAAARLLPGFVNDVFAQMPELPRDAMNISMQAQGCASLLKAVDTARWYLQANPDRSVLIVCSEVISTMSTPLMAEWYGTFSQSRSLEQVQRTIDVLHAFLFADASVAMLLRTDGPGPRFSVARHLTNELSSDAELGNIRGGGSNPPLFELRRPAFSLSPEIGKRGVHYARRTVERLLSPIARSVADFPEVLVHTGSSKILDSVRDSLRLSHEQTRVPYEVLTEYGNVTGASLGLMIDRTLRRDAKTPRDILLTTFGIGFSASAGLLSVTGD